MLPRLLHGVQLVAVQTACSVQPVRLGRGAALGITATALGGNDALGGRDGCRRRCVGGPEKDRARSTFARPMLGRTACMCGAHERCAGSGRGGG